MRTTQSNHRYPPRAITLLMACAVGLAGFLAGCTSIPEDAPINKRYEKPGVSREIIRDIHR